MGRQILFHALADDLRQFLLFASDRDPITVVTRDSPRSAIEAVSDPTTTTDVLMMWNRNVVPVIEREHVRRSAGPDYYEIPQSLPVLELSPSRTVVWDGRPALLRGRLYGSAFENSSQAYLAWYNALTRWIRSHFAKNPVKQLDGYVGPAALTWFRRGGVLLPWPEPSVSANWAKFVEDQQRVRDAPE